MNIKALEILESGRQSEFGSSASAATSIPFELELFGARLNLCAVCGEDELTLKDLVYPARQLSDIIIRQAIRYQLFCGTPVRCSAGCMACCKYAITVSPAEAFAINEMLGHLPRQSRLTLVRNMTIVGRTILNSCPSVIGAKNSRSSHASSLLPALSRWYSGLNLTCPWVENKRCSQYTSRPLVCREFMVTSPPAKCNPNVHCGRTVVDLPIKVSEILMDVCSRLANTKPEAIFLPLVPAWCVDTLEIQHQRFNAQEAAKVFVDAIQQYCKQTESCIMAVQ